MGVRNFAETPYIDAQNGQTYRSYDMDRDGFTLLAMGFHGPPPGGERKLGVQFWTCPKLSSCEP